MNERSKSGDAATNAVPSVVTTTSVVAATVEPEVASAAASGSDVAAKEPSVCHTGGQQHEQQQLPHNANGPPNNNSWPPKNSYYTAQPWQNGHRSRNNNNNYNNNNNRNNYGPNPHYNNNNNNNNSYRNNNRNQSNYRPKNSHWNQSLNPNNAFDRGEWPSHYQDAPNRERSNYYRQKNYATDSYRKSNFHKTWSRQDSRSKSREASESSKDCQSNQNNLETVNKEDQKCETERNSTEDKNEIKEPQKPENSTENCIKKPSEQAPKSASTSSENFGKYKSAPKEKPAAGKTTVKIKGKPAAVVEKEGAEKSKTNPKGNRPPGTKNISTPLKKQPLLPTPSGPKLSIATAPKGKQAGSNKPKPKQTEPKSTKENPTQPKIQVRPLNDLLKQDEVAASQERLLPPVVNASAVRTCPKPAIQAHRSTVSSFHAADSIEDSLNDRLAHMDKEALKNIINNSDTIFNEHLKVQARRRMREQIRKKLKEIEFEPPKAKTAQQFIENEAVEAAELPPLLLQEIENCFGNNISDKEKPEPKSQSAIESDQATQSPESSQTQVQQSSEPVDTMAKETDLMQRLKVSEHFKSMQAKKSGQVMPSEKDTSAKSKTERGPATTPNKSPPKKPQTVSPEAELVTPPAIKKEHGIGGDNSDANKCGVIVVTSSEDEDEPEKEEGRKKDAASTDSTKRRYWLKLESDANHIIDSFEKLILPHLKEPLAEQYRSNKCKQTRLHFISCVVTSKEYNSHKFNKVQVAKMQQNLKLRNNRLGLEFLLREIVSVVSQLKQLEAEAPGQALAKQQQASSNELTSSASPPAKKTATTAKIAEPTPGPHQKDDMESKSAEPAAGAVPAPPLMPPTPPRNGTPTPATVRPLHAPPVGLPYVGVDSTVSRLSPGSFSPNEQIMMMGGDSVTHSLLEIDRRLLENQNRRGFLEEMIMKLQREKTDLEMFSLELQNHKFLLLNTVIARHQTMVSTMTTATASATATATTTTTIAMAPPTTVTPTNSPTLPSPNVAATATATRQSNNRRVKRRAVVVKRVKVLAKRRRPQRVSAEPPSDNEDEICVEETVKPETKSDSPPPHIPPPLDIKQEPLSPSRSNDIAQKPSERPKRQHPTRSVAADIPRESVAVGPTLLQPQAPLDPSVNVSFDLPRILLRPIQTQPLLEEAPTAANVKTYNYDNIPVGRLHNISSPISQIRIYKEHIIAASENGDLFMFNIASHKLERQVTQHSEAITDMFVSVGDSCLYTTSLDGFLKKSSLENLERIIQTVYIKEPLQSIDVKWGIAFVGSRWGNLITYNILANKKVDVPLLSTGQSIIVVKAAKEGPRKIILLGCKGNVVFLHDSSTGLFLRRLVMPDGLNVYSLLLTDGHLFCGTQKNEVFKFDFSTGNITNTLSCGNGAATMSTYGERYLLIGCYDGFIYILNKETGLQLGRFKGSGHLVLALAIAGDKVVTSSRDNSLEILKIPSELLNVDQTTSD